MGTREQWEQYFKAILEGQEATAYEPQTGTGGAKDREEDKGAWAAHEICHQMVSTMLEGLASAFGAHHSQANSSGNERRAIATVRFRPFEVEVAVDLLEEDRLRIEIDARYSTARRQDLLNDQECIFDPSSQLSEISDWLASALGKAAIACRQ